MVYFSLAHFPFIVTQLIVSHASFQLFLHCTDLSSDTKQTAYNVSGLRAQDMCCFLTFLNYITNLKTFV